MPKDKFTLGQGVPLWHVSPTKHLGQKGVIRVIDQKVMIELSNGELWPCKGELGDLQDGLSVEVESMDEGYVQIRTL